MSTNGQPARGQSRRVAEVDALVLHRWEKIVVRWVRRWGTWGVVLRVATFVVTMSVAATGLSILINQPDATVVAISLVMAVVTPLVLAPPITWALASIVLRLDDATHLLAEAASIDPLTGVYNRRGLFEALEKCSARRLR